MLHSLRKPDVRSRWCGLNGNLTHLPQVVNHLRAVTTLALIFYGVYPVQQRGGSDARYNCSTYYLLVVHGQAITVDALIVYPQHYVRVNKPRSLSVSRRSVPQELEIASITTFRRKLATVQQISHSLSCGHVQHGSRVQGARPETFVPVCRFHKTCKLVSGVCSCYLCSAWAPVGSCLSKSGRTRNRFDHRAAVRRNCRHALMELF